VAIDWNDNTKRKAFREALQEAYPSDAELEMFVDEELNENLATIAGEDNLQVTAHGLVKWAKARGRLDEVYEAFKGQNPKHSVIKKLEQSSFVALTFNLTRDDWDSLFRLFLPGDLADLKRAFERGFNAAIGVTFQQAQPQHPPLVELAQIRELLEVYDIKDEAKGPVLAVRFVEFAIAELQRSNEDNNRNLRALEEWRDRISQQYNVSLNPAEPIKTTACHAYLLVALEEIGSDVIVYPELHIPGAGKSIGFGARPITCTVDQVADQILQWISQAEETPEILQCEEGEVILELFLPCKQLEEDIAATWTVKDKWGNTVELGTHRRFLVRSSERIRDPKIQKALKQKWQLLEACIIARNTCDKFHVQTQCPEKKGDLLALLKDLDTPGLKLIARLPTDSAKRRELFEDIIDAAVPIALWASEVTEIDVNTLETEFDTLLRQCNLTNFADLARQWRKRRIESVSAKHTRLLCDRPDRLPKLPDPNREEDLLVAS
jgi:hypothetical protein